MHNEKSERVCIVIHPEKCTNYTSAYDREQYACPVWTVENGEQSGMHSQCI